MANARLSREKQALILAALTEGMAINAVCRMFSVGKHGVLRVIDETGEALHSYMYRNFRDLPCKRLALDEAWQYVGQHGQRMTQKEKGKGDFWLWCGLDSDTKLVVGFHIGTRARMDCVDFVNDLAGRVVGSPQITTDQYPNYVNAIRSAFGNRCTYATEAKTFVDKFDAAEFPTKRKNGIPKIAKAERKAIFGAPDLGTATTAHVERLFLTVRQELKRFSRLTLGYSKDLMMHRRGVSMAIGIYNLCRKHKSLDSTPAVAAGIEEKAWTLEQVVDLTAAHMKRKEEEAFEAAFAKREASLKAWEEFE